MSNDDKSLAHKGRSATLIHEKHANLKYKVWE